MSWSYMGHVVATILDKSSIAYRQGHYSLVGCCVYPDMSPVAKSGVRGYYLSVGYCVCPNMSPVASCQGLGGTIR
ncbi:hypothetical protein GW17_00021078 [Ensete ventricosum]|nr:hypothetical protein GW17_00021078 [Ensete ventricosum]